MATLILVMHIVTTSAPDITNKQFTFAGISSFGLYVAFLFFQTSRHRDYYPPKARIKTNSNFHTQKASRIKARVNTVLLILSLITIVGLAELLSPAVKSGLVVTGAPKTIAGIAIAHLARLAEAFASIKAAKANRLQTSPSPELGSAIAIIKPPIRIVAIITIFFLKTRH